jgi:hypothetical protein
LRQRDLLGVVKALDEFGELSQKLDEAPFHGSRNSVRKGCARQKSISDSGRPLATIFGGDNGVFALRSIGVVHSDFHQPHERRLLRRDRCAGVGHGIR